MGLKSNFDHTKQLECLSYAIGYYRSKKGYTQEQLAEIIGISRQHLGAIEARNVDRGLSLGVLLDIATALEIEPYLLLKFKIET